MRLLAWGCNISGALGPSSNEHFIRRPTDVSTMFSADILWTGWSGIIARTPTGIQSWGALAFTLDIGPVKRILGHDEMLGYLDADGHICDLHMQRSPTAWDDASVSGFGVVYVFRQHDGLYSFQSLQIISSGSTSIQHPAFNPKHPARLYSMESRAFIHSTGPMHQLFEIMPNDTLVLIEDLEGMEFHIVAGSCNRLGIVTDAGAAYVLEHRSQEIDLIEAPGDVTLLGLGSDFDIVVIGDMVLARGNNEFGQLGRADTKEFAEVLKGTVAKVSCSRWSTILTMH